jgi:hypothetical protein
VLRADKLDRVEFVARTRRLLVVNGVDEVQFRFEKLSNIALIRFHGETSLFPTQKSARNMPSSGFARKVPYAGKLSPAKAQRRKALSRF